MRILIGYESSGVMRRAFRAKGHDAWSCDILPAQDGSPYHYQCDIWAVAHMFWDMAIFHPECTFFTVAAAWALKDGPYHQKVAPDTIVGAARRQAFVDHLANWRMLVKLPYPKAIENPSPSMVSRHVGKPTQVIQPYEFGDDASKGTGLWLHGLPPLRIDPKMRHPGRWVFHKGLWKERWSNQTDSGQNKLTPGPDRWRERSRTYDGIANACVAAWG